MVSYINELNPRQITNHIYFSTLKLLGHVMVFNFRLRVKNQSIAAIKDPNILTRYNLVNEMERKNKSNTPTKKESTYTLLIYSSYSHHTRIYKHYT